MSEGNGYILIHRKIFNSFLWRDKPFTKGQAWIDLLLLTNHTERDEIIKGAVIHVNRGQLLRSRQVLADRWGWNVKTVDGYLKTLKKHKMVDYKGTPQGTLITVDNYDFYQHVGGTKRTPKRTADWTRTINYNELQGNINKYTPQKSKFPKAEVPPDWNDDDD